MHVPDKYKGREQAYIKHMLLWGYLEQLIMIIGHSRARRITFVDCFAGPWQDESDTLSGTSIGISLEIMRRCRNAFIKRGKHVPTFRALYVEKNRESFDRLQSFLSEPREGIETKALRGDFNGLKREILDWCGPDAFAFFFIDPKGWKDVSMPKLRPLLERPNSEFLINLMYDFVNRAVSQEKFAQDMHDLFGEDVSRIVDLSTSSKERERGLMMLYRQRLCEAVPMTGERPYTSAMPVLDPRRDRTKYHLVYLTRHPLGITEFAEQSEKLDIIQPQVRAQAKQDRRIAKNGQLELFGANDVGDAAQRQTPLLDIMEYWMRQLTTEPRLFGLTEFAKMHEVTGWFHSTLQEGLGALIAEGRVRNMDARKKRTKNFVNFKTGEHLVRVQ